jgi:hypothetical protein
MAIEIYRTGLVFIHSISVGHFYLKSFLKGDRFYFVNKELTKLRGIVNQLITPMISFLQINNPA